MSEIDDLVAVYKASLDSLSEQKKAELEKELWDVYKSSIPAGQAAGHRRAWFKSVFDDSPTRYEHRQHMLSSGSWVQPFWDLYESGVPHWTIFRLYQTARTLAVEKSVIPAVAAKRVLEAHFSGKVVDLPPDSRPEESAPEELVPLADPFVQDSQISRTKAFIARLASMTDEYVKASLVGLSADQASVRKAVSDFSSYVSEASEDFRRKLSSLRSSATRDAQPRVSRSQFRSACEVLGVSFQFGGPVDLKACKRMMLNRARDLHPDKNGGSHSARAEYQAVIESYGLLESYAEGMKNENGEFANG